MGCDITIHMELKLLDKWEHYKEVPFYFRNYRIFSKMAGVRGMEVPISNPKGFPKDVNYLTKSFLIAQEEHSFSYLDGLELSKVYKWIKRENKKIEGSSDCDISNYCFNFIEEMKDDYIDDYIFTKDFRIVFGFDS